MPIWIVLVTEFVMLFLIFFIPVINSYKKNKVIIDISPAIIIFLMINLLYYLNGNRAKNELTLIVIFYTLIYLIYWIMVRVMNIKIQEKKSKEI